MTMTLCAESEQTRQDGCAPHERQEHGFGDHEAEGCLRERAPFDEAEETAKHDLLQKLIDLPPVPRRAGTNECRQSGMKPTTAACVQIRWNVTL
jgi:hypothetical protein